MAQSKKKKLKKIKFLINTLREDINVKYHRVLPLNEYLGNRWEKASYLQWGEGSNCYDSAYIFGDVKVGENTFVGPFCILDGGGGLRIGKFCSISAGVQIYTHHSVRWANSGGRESLQYAPCGYKGDNMECINSLVCEGGSLTNNHFLAREVRYAS